MSLIYSFNFFLITCQSRNILQHSVSGQIRGHSTSDQSSTSIWNLEV